MAEPTPYPSFTSQFTLKSTGENVFETTHKPTRVGNPLNIAYGGYALGVACKAACLSVPKGYHLYSLLGSYLGPAYTDRQLIAHIRVIRQTRTFATRQVEVGQKNEKGEFRACLVALADFQVREKGTLLEYARKPANEYPNWKDCPTQSEAIQKLVDEEKVSKEHTDAHAKNFSIFPKIYELRSIPSAIFSQNLYGIAKHLPHTQDELPLPKRTTADWFRCHQPLSSAADHVTNLAFTIDGAIAFTPLSFSHMWFDDVAAVSSLDFALRIFQNGREEGDEDGIDMTKWHLREMGTMAGGNGRAYGESWVWDERGRAVACMSQQSILRPKAAKSGKL